jgi:tetratricopeptide (TPR) repeat protein
MFMLRVALALAMLSLAAGAADKGQQNSSPAQPTGEASAQNAASADLRLHDAYTTFQNKDYAGALAISREVALNHPENVQAHNLIGNCALELKDYPTAVAAFKRALQLMPDEEHNLTGIMKAYALAGMTKEIDGERAHLREILEQGRLSKDFCYMFETYKVGDKNVRVTECPKLAGRYNVRYWFHIYDANDQLLRRVALESDDIDQTLWAKSHPDLAAAGQRDFSLDGYAQNTHALYRFYEEGEPSYQQLREDVARIIAGEFKPVTGMTYATAPAQRQAQTPPPSTPTNK